MYTHTGIHAVYMHTHTEYTHANTRTALKVMPPMFLRQSVTSEVDGGGMVVAASRSHSSGADFYQCSMQACFNHWQKCIANGCVESIL